MKNRISSILSCILLFGIILIPSANSKESKHLELDIIDDMILGEELFNFNPYNQINVNYNYITRDRIIEIAEGFLNHEWYPTEDNIFHGTYIGREVDTPDRDTYNDWPDHHGWKANQPAQSIPYQWGGFSSINGYNLSAPKDFDEQYTGTGFFEGRIHFAGDINFEDYTSQACGLDCSGFVSRCWNLPYKHATYTFSDVVSPIRYYELQSGDILNIPYYHVILFKEFVDEENTLIRTIECGGPAPNVNEHIYKIISTSNDSFSVKLEGYPLTENFGLYRYEFIDNTPRTPSINGPASGNKGTEYTYKFFTTDPESDPVSYCVDWGDDSEMQWLGPFESGENLNISHIWEESGTYHIRVKAKDIHDIESGWATLEINMPRLKQQSFLNLGDFHAEIGLNNERESLANLVGTQRIRGRFIVVNGMVNKGGRENRFQGFFRDNFFVLQIPINDRYINIIGKVRIDSYSEKFTGLWKTRNSRLNGWIQGNFN